MPYAPEWLDQYKKKAQPATTDLLDFSTLQAIGMSPFGSPFTDIAGFVGDVGSMYKNPEERTLGNAGLASLGLLPFIPAGIGAIKGYKNSPYEYLHGGKKDADLKSPLYLTKDPYAANFYADSLPFNDSIGGTIYPTKWKPKKPLDMETTEGLSELKEIANNLNISMDDINKAFYKANNTIDEDRLSNIAYIEKFRDELKRRGYDSLKGMDDLGGDLGVHDFIVPMNPNKVFPPKITKYRTTKGELPFSNESEMLDYNEVLTNPEYADSIGKNAAIRYMSPDEYIERSARGYQIQENFENQALSDMAAHFLSKSHLPSSYADLEHSRRMSKIDGINKVEQYAKDMAKGDRFPLPFLDFSGSFGPFAQEGLHRAFAAKDLGMPEIPVMMVSKARRKK